MPWLGEYGWLPTWWPGFELISVTRPLLEHLVRQRLLAQSAVTVHEDARVVGLHPVERQWQLSTEDGRTFVADRVIDASGRSSRMPHWLAELGVRVPEPLQVDAHLGYACRLYRANGQPPLETGVLIAGTPATGRGAIALPVENGHWLVIEGGYGHHRPTREPAEFEAFLAGIAGSGGRRCGGPPRTGQRHRPLPADLQPAPPVRPGPRLARGPARGR